MPTIVFDFDDTLVHTTKFFFQAQQAFADKMEKYNFPKPELLKTLNEIDIKNVKACGGFAKHCFPTALVETYEYFCRKHNISICPHTREDVENIGWWVFDQHPPLVEGAHEVLEKLSDTFRLVLATKGDFHLQTSRLSQSGLEGYFEKVYVLHNKTEQEYQQIAVETGLTLEKSWMIGNSMKSDINPAYRAGFNCIYIESDCTWEFELEPPQSEYIELFSIKQIPSFLEEWSKRKMI